MRAPAQVCGRSTWRRPPSAAHKTGGATQNTHTAPGAHGVERVHAWTWRAQVSGQASRGTGRGESELSARPRPHQPSNQREARKCLCGLKHMRVPRARLCGARQTPRSPCPASPGCSATPSWSCGKPKGVSTAPCLRARKQRATHLLPSLFVCVRSLQRPAPARGACSVRAPGVKRSAAAQRAAPRPPRRARRSPGSAGGRRLGTGTRRRSCATQTSACAAPAARRLRRRRW